MTILLLGYTIVLHFILYKVGYEMVILKSSKKNNNIVSFYIPFFCCRSTMFQSPKTLSMRQDERDRQVEGCKIGSEGSIAEMEKEIYKLVLRVFEVGINISIQIS